MRLDEALQAARSGWASGSIVAADDSYVAVNVRRAEARQGYDVEVWIRVSEGAQSWLKTIPTEAALYDELRRIGQDATITALAEGWSPGRLLPQQGDETDKHIHADGITWRHDPSPVDIREFAPDGSPDLPGIRRILGPGQRLVYDEETRHWYIEYGGLEPIATPLLDLLPRTPAISHAHDWRKDDDDDA